MPSIPLQPLPRLDNHVPHQLAVPHERGAELLRARPRLRTPAVEVDAVGARRNEGRRARHLERHVGAELDDGDRLAGVGRDGYVYKDSVLALLFPVCKWRGDLAAVACEAVAVELLREDHGRPAEINAILVNCLAKGKLYGEVRHIFRAIRAIHAFPYRTIGARAFRNRSCFLVISNILRGLYRE